MVYLPKERPCTKTKRCKKNFTTLYDSAQMPFWLTWAIIILEDSHFVLKPSELSLEHLDYSLAYTRSSINGAPFALVPKDILLEVFLFQ